MITVLYAASYFLVDFLCAWAMFTSFWEGDYGNLISVPLPFRCPLAPFWISCAAEAAEKDTIGCPFYGRWRGCF